LVSEELAGFAFSSSFAALRPLPDGPEALWLWAILNSTAGTAARLRLLEGAEFSKEGAEISTLPLSRLLELPVPVSSPSWMDVRGQVLELRQRAALARPEEEIGQSWWRTARLRHRQRWDLVLATPRPELLEQGIPLRELAQHFRAGRRIKKLLEVSRSGWFPALIPEDLRKHGQPRRWTPEVDGVVGRADDIVVTAVGRRGQAAVLRQPTVIDAGLVVIRLFDRNLATRIVDFLISERGQSLRALHVSGASIPHLGLKALQDLRVPQDVFERHGQPAPLSESMGKLSTELDRLLWT
jgi:hypothetical protein